MGIGLHPNDDKTQATPSQQIFHSLYKQQQQQPPQSTVLNPSPKLSLPPTNTMNADSITIYLPPPPPLSQQQLSPSPSHLSSAGNKSTATSPSPSTGAAKLYSGSGGNLSINDLLLSTSVPIKIGGDAISHTKDSQKSSNRIRYTFGLSALKTSTSSNKPTKFNSEQMQMHTQTPNRANKIDRNSNNKSMESLHLSGSIAIESNNLKNKQYSTESLPANYYDENHRSTTETNIHAQPQYPLVLPQSQAQHQPTSKAQYIEMDRKTNGKFVKQTTIDYYV